MLACLDATYTGEQASAACLLFEDWGDSDPVLELVHSYPAPEPYRSGLLYRRELPSLLVVLRAAPSTPALLIVDGYVWLDSDLRPGLGGHLYAALARETPVVGVAKRSFRGAPAIPVLRGRSSRPLFVSAAGAEPEWAATKISQMHGRFRIPTLLKRVDRLSRSQTEA